VSHSDAFWTNAGAIRQILTEIHNLGRQLKAMSDTLQAEIQSLRQQVAQQSSVNQSAITLLKGLHDQLEAALANAHEQGVDPDALQQLHDLAVQLGAQSQSLAAAVEENTPASGGTPPTS
jgi:ABC-type sugar transport system ATPase subunit